MGVIFRTASGEVEALRQISFETADREFLSILGPSGCGKTTLLKVLAGILRPTSGRMEAEPCPSDHSRSVLLVPQDRSLFPWMNAMDNAAFGLEMQKVPLPARRKRVGEIFREMGFDGRESFWPHELSQGMRQRVALARCFACEPAVMLMDEPFAALDCLRRLELQQLLLNLWEKRHTTVIFVTHDIEEALLLSDRVLVFSKQPGTIRAEFKVLFPRPRTLATALSAEFLDLKRRVAEVLGMPTLAASALAQA